LHLSLSFDEYNKLLINYSKNEIDDILDDIQNHKNNKKYTSLYLTALKWLKNTKDRTSLFYSPQTTKSQAPPIGMNEKF